MAAQQNAQREMQMLTEWLATLPAGYQWKTHVRVGATPLTYQGKVLSPAQQRAFEVWNDWADVRVATPTELWIVEGKIVGVAGAYGQALDYANEYPASSDAAQFPGKRIVPVVVCAFEKARTAAYFARFGVRTVLFTPSWAGSTLATKIFPASSN